MYYLGATHNVFKFLEVGIMAEGGDDSAQDIHQPSNRNVHFWQNYYSIFENQDPPPTHTPATRIHTHTMTEREAFMICMKSICLFQQLPVNIQHQNYFNVGLGR